MYARKPFENKIFWKKVVKKPCISQLDFFLFTQPFFMEKIMKNKRGLEFVTSLSLGC